MEIDDSVRDSINEYSTFISNKLPLHIQDLNQTHILYPDNLLRFADMRFKTLPQNRIFQVDESKKIDYLGISLGKYVNEAIGLNWCYAADVKNSSLKMIFDLERNGILGIMINVNDQK